MSRQAGLLLLVVGAGLMLVGVVAYFGGLSWLGRLPGDIRIENERTRIYIPITTMILLSVLLSALMWIVNRLR